jgi:hypothetical protein
VPKEVSGVVKMAFEDAGDSIELEMTRFIPYIFSHFV